MKRRFALIVVRLFNVGLFAFAGAQQADLPRRFTGKVVRAADGPTITVLVDQHKPIHELVEVVDATETATIPT